MPGGARRQQREAQRREVLRPDMGRRDRRVRPDVDRPGRRQANLEAARARPSPRDQIKLVSDWVITKTRQLIPFKSNQPHLSRAQWATHKRMQIAAMRAAKRRCEPLRERVESWNVDLRNPQERAGFTTRPVDLNFLGTRSIAQITAELENGPLRDDKATHKDGSPFIPQEMAEGRAKNAVRFRIGNCGEQSAMAFNLLMEYTNDVAGAAHLPQLLRPGSATPAVEWVWLIGDADHAFVVVNRNVAQPIGNLASWFNAVICDPWWQETSVDPREANGGLMNYIAEHQQALRVRLAMPLGSGHTARWTRKGGEHFWGQQPVDVNDESIPRFHPPNPEPMRVGE